jgi:hypothetical protein
LASLSKASKRGALSAGIADLSREPGSVNTLGATFFRELHAIYAKAFRLINVIWDVTPSPREHQLSKSKTDMSTGIYKSHHK